MPLTQENLITIRNYAKSLNKNERELFISKFKALKSEDSKLQLVSRLESLSKQTKFGKNFIPLNPDPKQSIELNLPSSISTSQSFIPGLNVGQVAKSAPIAGSLLGSLAGGPVGSIVGTGLGKAAELGATPGGTEGRLKELGSDLARTTVLESLFPIAGRAFKPELANRVLKEIGNKVKIRELEAVDKSKKILSEFGDSSSEISLPIGSVLAKLQNTLDKVGDPRGPLSTLIKGKIKYYNGLSSKGVKRLNFEESRRLEQQLGDTIKFGPTYSKTSGIPVDKTLNREAKLLRSEISSHNDRIANNLGYPDIPIMDRKISESRKIVDQFNKIKSGELQLRGTIGALAGGALGSAGGFGAGTGVGAALGSALAVGSRLPFLRQKVYETGRFIGRPLVSGVEQGLRTFFTPEEF